MKLYTFEDFVRSLRSQMNFDNVYRNILMGDNIPFIPKYAIDRPDSRLRHSGVDKFNDLADYELNFASLVHMAPDNSTIYFVEYDDALMFMLAAS